MVAAPSPLPSDDLSRALTAASADAADARPVAVAGGAYTVLLTGAQTAGRYSLIDMLVPRNLSTCDVGHCRYVVITDQDGVDAVVRSADAV